MNTISAYAAHSATENLKSFNYEPREIGANDVLIEILFCGVCHSDIHSARNEWGGAVYPLVPGHEIIGKVSQVGSDVKKYQAGDTVGVGCMVDSCQTCSECAEGLEQYCDKTVFTYNSLNPKTNTMTYGGYAKAVVVDENFVVSIADGVDLAASAPLLCAGSTVYSPFKHWNIGPGSKVGVAGLGGLGHMGVKIANALGAEVTVFTTSENKKDEAKRLGAHNVIISKNMEEVEKYASYFDLILNTISAVHNYDMYITSLKRDGVLVFVGLPDDKHPSPTMGPLLYRRRSIAGTLISGVAETQEMLDFCAKHKITADIEMIKIEEINTAFERMIKNDVKYRFVIDMTTL